MFTKPLYDHNLLVKNEDLSKNSDSGPPVRMDNLLHKLTFWNKNSHIKFEEDLNIVCHLCNEENNTLIYGYSNIIKLVRLDTLESVRFEHSEVICMSINKDFTILFSGHTSGEIVVWSVDNHSHPIQILKQHTNKVTFLEITPDGKHLISCSEDLMIALWDMECNILHTFLEHTREVTCLKVTNGLIITGSQNSTVHILCFETSFETYCHTEHRSPIICLEITSDCTKAVTASSNPEIRVWNLLEKLSLGVLLGHRTGVISLCISPDNSRLVSSDLDCVIIIWDFESRKELSRLDGHTGVIQEIMISEDCNHFVTGSIDGSLKIWNLKYPSEQGYLEKQQASVEKMSFIKGKIVSRYSDNSIIIWDLAECDREYLSHYTVNLTCIAICQGTYRNLALGDTKGNSLLIFDLKNPRTPLWILDNALGAQIDILAFSAKGGYLAMASFNFPIIKIIDMREALTINAIIPIDAINYSSRATKIAITNGGLLIGGFADGLVLFWSIFPYRVLFIPCLLLLPLLMIVLYGYGILAKFKQN